MARNFFTLLTSVALLAACASQPLYQVPSDGQALADVKLQLDYTSRNLHDALFVRGESICVRVPVLRLAQPKIERPGLLVARAAPGQKVFNTRLPAGQPLALQFWQQQGSRTGIWSLVVLLEPGRSYEARLDDKTGPSIVDTATRAEAPRLPPHLLKDELNCS